MKIEKVNENQIRCTLTKQDLADRQINLRELAYGSEKAKGLFHDMIEQANSQFGFEANDIPLMVEAIPVSSESLILVITKVEYPEELDPRFSRFTETDEEGLFADMDEDAAVGHLKGADEVLDLFKKLCKEPADAPKEDAADEAPEVLSDLASVFEFHTLDQVVCLARALDGSYQARNDLYRNTSKNRFLLIAHKGDHTPEQFNKVCNVMSEYAKQSDFSAAKEAYLMEHGNKMLGPDALHVLASL